ncbi:MAG: DUF2157 domain-containing protein [Clostridia bacterium]|nr:DUF2157 domain-containing protein [Clostridia bacterium]
MAKVSVNIKKLRSDRGMTQDMLAEKINVTRQTVSSWENGRTQPDIDMLELLADAFGTEIEELIYGEKRKIGLEAPKTDKHKIMNIVFATLGSLLTATGLIIILVSFWDRIPEIFLAALSFLPLIAGGIAALWVYGKKKDSIAWTEGACVMWCAGLFSTTALVCSMFSVNVDISILFTALALLTLPVAYIMNTLFPLTAYFFIVTYLIISFPLNLKAANLIPITVGLILYILGIFRIKKMNNADARHKFAVWIAIISACVVLFFKGLDTADRGEAAVLCMIFGVLAGLYAADREGDFPYPFRYIAVPSVAALFSFLCFVSDDVIGMCNYYPHSDVNLLNPGNAPFVSAVALIAGIIYGRKNNPFSKEKKAFIICSAVGSALCAAGSILAEYYTDDTETAVSVITIILSLAVSITLIAAGIKKAKLLTVNLGLVMICVIIFATFIMGKFDVVYGGIACVVMGLVLLFINFRLSKMFKAKEAEKNA